jgi:hypothetical protein
MSDQEDVLNIILRDQASGWKYDDYSSSKTMMDVPLAKAAHSVRQEKAYLKQLSGMLETLTTRIEEARDPPKQPKKDEKEKPLTEKEIEELEEEYTVIYKKKCAQMILLEQVEAVYKEVEWKRYIEVKRYEMLHDIRNAFMQDGDLALLEKETVRVSDYIAKLKTMI